MLTLLAAAKAPETYDLKGAVVWLQGFGLLVLLVIIVYLTGKALLGPGREGDINKSFSFVGAVVITLIPLGFITGVGLLTGTGGAILNTVLKILS